MIHSASAYPRLQVGSDVDNLDRPNARDPPATARRERAYKFGQAQRARGVQLFGHEPRISVPASSARDGGRPMSTNAPTLTREQWRTVLDDTDRPTFGELVSTIEAAAND